MKDKTITSIVNFVDYAESGLPKKHSWQISKILGKFVADQRCAARAGDGKSMYNPRDLATRGPAPRGSTNDALTTKMRRTAHDHGGESSDGGFSPNVRSRPSDVGKVFDRRHKYSGGPQENLRRRYGPPRMVNDMPCTSATSTLPPNHADAHSSMVYAAM